MVVSTNHFFEGISKHEQKEHVSEEMGGAGVEEERGKESPDSSGQQVVPAEHKICIDEVGVLLASQEAQAYASTYESIVDPQPDTPSKRSAAKRPISEVPNHLRALFVIQVRFVRAVSAKP